MRLLWLPEVLRAAGLAVSTYPGWETRGSSSWGPLRGIVCHATAGARNSSDAAEMRVLWETGSVTAPVPISQLYLSRSGQWTVGATGLCYHVLIGQRGPHRGYGNSALIGIEAANDNRGEPWPAVQVDAYIRGVAAICRYMGWSADVVVGHREHQNDKSDPVGIDMNDFRQRVAALLAGGPSGQEADMATIVRNHDDGQYYILGSDGVARRLLLRTANGISDVGYVASGRWSNNHQGPVPGLLPFSNRPIDQAPWIEIPSAPLGVLAVEAPAVEVGDVVIDYARIDASVRDAVADGYEGGAARVRAGAAGSQAATATPPSPRADAESQG
ncbi:MAG: N-acetylmuramoyl-L-alanine amidase [Micromonosporaceae bacterium]|nr:N-acetylmuramoyl-L-alanine amidase [Micromonosporaceae bacterium]